VLQVDVPAAAAQYPPGLIERAKNKGPGAYSPPKAYTKSQATTLYAGLIDHNRTDDTQPASDGNEC
jgi:hypothetical protein